MKTAKKARDMFSLFKTRFQESHVPVHASALTYTSLLTLFPCILFFSLAVQMLGFVDLLYQALPNLETYLGFSLPPQLWTLLEENVQRLQKISWHRIGLVGVGMLVLSVLLALSNLEKAMNVIWSIKKNRNWFQRIPIYSPLMLFLGSCGLFLVLLLTRFKSQLDAYSSLQQETLGSFFPSFSVTLFAVIAWLYMYFLFYVMPNTKVKAKVAALSATITSVTIYFFVKIVISFQAFLFARYSVLYGSLSLLPLIMITLYICWIIFLAGVALAYAYQRSVLGIPHTHSKAK
jgi:membrane protein